MMAARTVSSALRTAFYGGISAVFAISDVEAVKMVDAALVGVVLADYMTWLIRSVLLLPSYILHGCYDAAIGFLFGWFLFRVADIEVKLDESSVVTAFLTFLLVAAVKVAYYGLVAIQESAEDDG